MKNLLLPALLATTALTACEKDEPKAKTKTDLLVGKRWRVSAALAFITVGGQAATQDVLPFQAACSKDDFVTFRADKTLTEDEGPTKCQTTDAQTRAGTWELSADQTKLTTTVTGRTAETGTLLELTETTLVVEQQRILPVLGAAKVKVTFTPF